MKIEIAGQNAFIIYFADETSAEVSASIQAAENNLKVQMAELLIDLVPSYASLLVIYDINMCDHFEALKRLKLALSDLNKVNTTSGELITLPVYYIIFSCPVLSFISFLSNLIIYHFIYLHHHFKYLVYSIFFSPFFSYLF